MIQKPLLACKAPDDLTKLHYPVMVSPKLDGIRCLTLPLNKPGRRCRAVTRKLKPVPNDHIRALLEAVLLPGCDGELLLSDWTAPFNEVSSAIMSKAGKPTFHYAMFDFVDGEEPVAPFQLREGRVQMIVGAWEGSPEAPWLWRVRHTMIHNAHDLEAFSQQMLEQGFEGVMIRDPRGTYKFGRSTVKEGILLKLKPWDDEEATVIGVVERMRNENELQRDELGYAKRSSAKEGKVGAGTLGALRCRLDDGTEFEVGTGFDDKQRAQLWHDYVHHPTTHGPVGRVVIFTYQPPPAGRQPGQAPRFPVFLGFRHPDDMADIGS